MLFRNLGYLGLVAGVTMSVAACGSSSSDSGGGGTGTGGTSAGGSAGAAPACTDCVHPPDPTASAPDGDGTGQIFAIKTLDLGGDPQVTPDHWKDLGYDLDGKKSTPATTDDCKLAANTPNHIREDGKNGIDNSFGRNILPALPSEPQNKVNDALTAGDFTILISVDKLGSKTDYVKLPAALYAGAALNSTDPDAGPIAPKWDGNDQWPVFCELLQTCNDTGTPQLPTNTSKVLFPNSYVAGGTWVSGAKGEGMLQLSLSVAGYALSLTVHNALITAKLGTETPVPTTGTSGIVAGILKTDEVLSSLQQMAGKLSSSYCSGESLQSFLDQVQAASDIMVDGTQDPKQSCNGISIGLGFEVGAAKIGKVLDKAPKGEDPCLGVDASTD
jgi:hypothetical protein